MVEHFINKANQEMGRHVVGVTEKAMKLLGSYTWPGNVRELENQIKRAIVLSREDVLPEYLFEMKADQLSVIDQKPEDRLSEITRRYLMEALNAPQPSGTIFVQAVGIVEKTLIQEALQRTGGNQVQAAQLLGMHRKTLSKKRKDYGI